LIKLDSLNYTGQSLLSPNIQIKTRKPQSNDKNKTDKTIQ